MTDVRGKKIAEGVYIKPMSIDLAIPRDYIHRLSSECEKTGKTASEILVEALDNYFGINQESTHITH